MSKPKPVLRAKFPAKANILFEPHRYKVLYGGRGSGKSYAVARYLLLAGLSNSIRVLCTREVQKSIRDSVKRLLEDQIELLGMQNHYQSYESEIRGKNGTLFLFNGLSTETADSLKSYENIAKVWCEEAQSISKRSWDILIPTVRAENSEILITFNPQLETDETYRRFILNPPPDCVSVKMNYRDNPWFPSVLEQERIYCQQHDPDNYPNIWEGACKPAVEGAIYFREIQDAVSQGRICRVPYDPLLTVHVVFDLGFNDNMAIALVQRHVSEIRIIDYIQDTGKTLHDYSEELKTRKYNWGRLWLPHDGYASDYKTGLSSASIMRRLGWDVPDKSEIAQLSVEEGIRVVKLSFPQLYIDEDHCGQLIECLKRYRRRVNRETMTPGGPVHDEFSDGADCLRYVCVNANSMINHDPHEVFWSDVVGLYDERVVNQVTGY